MSFLRSIIADARPRERVRELFAGPPAIGGRKGHGLDGNAFGAEEKSQSPADQTSHLSTLLPIQEGASDVSMGDAAAFQADRPINQDVEPSGSLADIGNISGKESTGDDANSSLQAVEDTGQLSVDEPMPSATDGNTPARGELTGAMMPDDRYHSESSLTHPEALTIQADGTETTDLTSPQGSRRIESSVFEPSGQASGKAPMPDDSAGANEVEKALADGEKASVTERDVIQEPAGTIMRDSRMNRSKRPDHDPFIASAETPGAQNRASGHEETESACSPAGIRDMPRSELTDCADNSALRVAESTARLGAGEMTPPAAAGNMPAQGEALGVMVANDRHPSESTIKDPETLTIQADATHTDDLTSAQSSRRIESSVFEPSRQASRQASVPDDYAGSNEAEKASTSARSPGSRPSKPGSPIQHIAGPAMSSASPEALRSVPTRPFLTDLTPKGRDSFHSRLPLRSPERKHEAPKVQIGQIDVVIEAAARPATRPAPAPPPVDLASRHYLRRL